MYDSQFNKKRGYKNMYQYKNDDLIYDIESLDNLFTFAGYYPKPDHLVIYYIDDDNLINNDDIKHQIKQRIRQVVPQLQQSKIDLYDITSGHDGYLFNLHNFAKMLGVTAQSTPNSEYYLNRNSNGLTAPSIKMMNGKVDIDINHPVDPVAYATPETDENDIKTIGGIWHHLADYLYKVYTGSDKDKSQQKIMTDQAINVLNRISVDKLINPQYTPVNTTDANYNGENVGQGLRLGYNSHNYDETMLAGLLGQVNWTCFEKFKNDFINNLCPADQLTEHAQKELQDKRDPIYDEPITIVPSAKQLRATNNQLFKDENIGSMRSYWNGLKYSNSNAELATLIQRAWKYTNRYLDVAALNEHQRHISLKRLSGVLGLKIKESDQLDANKSHLEQHDVPELIAYNVNDVFNTKILFEQKVYQDSMSLRNDLLDLYPQLQYNNINTLPNSDKPDLKNPNFKRDPQNITTYRINSDSSSAQVIAKVIAPSKDLTDNKTIDLTYPDAKIFEDLKNDTEGVYGEHYQNLHSKDQYTVYYEEDQNHNIKTKPLIEHGPYNVLEQTKNWYNYMIRQYYEAAVQDIENGTAPDGLTVDQLKHNWQQAWKNFENIYNYYNEVQHQNVNATLIPGYQEMDPDEREWAGKRINGTLKRLMIKYDKLSPEQTGLNMYYYDRYGRKTSCFARFSVGGIHGQEANIKRFQKQMNDYNAIIDDYNRETAQINLLADIHQLIKQRGQNNNDTLKQIITSIKDDPTSINPLLKAEYADKYQNIDDDQFNQQLTTLDYDLIFTKRGLLRKNPPKPKREPKKPAIFKVPTPSKRDEQLTALCADNTGTKNYTFSSTGIAFHEDFSSYYPLLLSRLAIFRDASTGIDTYSQLYLERLKLKAKLGTVEFKSPEWNEINQQQLLRKLLLNSASGAGDAKFYSPIRMNNKITSMRIIGQLFAWRIGQAEAFEGARVISTNTDGLYTMPNNDFPSFNEAKNEEVLFNTVKPMLVDIEPETVTYFVSKDANNRLEEYDGVIKSAKGGTLNSSDGPSVSNNLSHPALIDAALAKYLDRREACDQPFNAERTKQLLTDALQRSKTDDQGQTDILKFSQWITQANPSKQRYQVLKDPDTGKYQILDRTNRAYLIKNKPSYQATTGEMYIVTAIKTKKSSVFTEDLINNFKAELKQHSNEDPIDWLNQSYPWLNDDPDKADKQRESLTALCLLIKANAHINEHTIDQLVDLLQSSHKEPVINKITLMPDHQLVELRNESWTEIKQDSAHCQELIDNLDVDAYVQMTKASFNKSWHNNYD